jgi:hypothetical protein
MVNTSGMTEEQIKQISIAATDGYGKAFNDSEAKSFKEQDSEKQKEDLEEYARSLGYTDASVSKDGSTVTYKDAEG